MIVAGFINLKNLELLDLSESTLNSSNIFQTIGTMTSLKTLMLVSCSLNGQLPTSQGNLRLMTLTYQLLQPLGSIFQLQSLDLGHNKFHLTFFLKIQILKMLVF